MTNQTQYNTVLSIFKLATELDDAEEAKDIIESIHEAIERTGKKPTYSILDDITLALEDKLFYDELIEEWENTLTEQLELDVESYFAD